MLWIQIGHSPEIYSGISCLCWILIHDFLLAEEKDKGKSRTSMWECCRTIRTFLPMPQVEGYDFTMCGFQGRIILVFLRQGVSKLLRSCKLFENLWNCSRRLLFASTWNLPEVAAAATTVLPAMALKQAEFGNQFSRAVSSGPCHSMICLWRNWK